MKRVAAVAVIVAFLAGCSTTEQQGRTEGTAAGAGIGAAVGAGLGALIGGGKGAAIGAGVGGLAGAGVGYSYANKVANRHKQLQGKENDLDTQISYVRSVNDDTEKYNAQLKKEIESLEPQVNALEAKVRREEVDRATLEKEKLALGKKLEEAKKNQAVAEQEYERAKGFRAQHGQSEKLDAEVKRLETALAELKKQTDALAALNQRI
jgi:hypothetical protein